MKTLYLYGAGRIGRLFINSSIFEEIKREYESVRFFDSNQNLTGKVGNVCIYHDLLDSSPDKVDILITSGYWSEIYDECVLSNHIPIGIYDENDNRIKSYEKMCFDNGVTYKNREYIGYENERERELKTAVENYNLTHDLFRSVKGLAIGLSNLCNYAGIHKLCPANCINGKEILPTNIVKKVLDEFSAMGFEGVIYFHLYNEPLMDPRFFYFCDMVKRTMPKARVMAYSNGYYLNQTMVDDLQNIGVDIITVTGYGKNEYRRLQSLNVEVPYRIVYGNLDERMDIYSRSIHNHKDSYDPCRSFIAQTCVFSDGSVGICCLDYKHPYDLGSVFYTSVESILNSERVITLQDELLSGQRDRYAICQNCNWGR